MQLFLLFIFISKRHSSSQENADRILVIYDKTKNLGIPRFFAVTSFYVVLNYLLKLHSRILQIQEYPFAVQNLITQLLDLDELQP